MNKLLLVTILFFFTTFIQAQTVILSEDFNTSLNNTWYPSFPGINNITAAENSTTPSGDGWVGRLDNSIGGGVGAALTGSPELSDFYYEARFFVTMDVATYYGIEFRVDSTGSSKGYNFLIRPKGGFLTPRIRFRDRVGTSPTTIRDWEGTTIPGFPTEAGWHKLAVHAKADSFWLYYDDQLLPGSPVVDTTYTSGFVGLYYWDMTITDSVMLVDDLLVTDKMATAIETPKEIIPKTSYLSQNYPNPFNPTTTIEFNLSKSSHVDLIVYNITGKSVKTLINETLSVGTQKANWDGTDSNGNSVAAGVYLYSLKTEAGTETKKMILIK